MPSSYEETKCPRCGKPFRQLVVTVLGQEAYRAKSCGECLAVETEEMAKDDRGAIR